LLSRPSRRRQRRSLVNAPSRNAPAPITGLSARANPEPVRLQFPNADVREVLESYGWLTGKRVVTDDQVQGQVYIVAPGEVSPEEATRIIEINLQLNGFTMIPAERSDIIKVVGTGKNPRSAAIHHCR
jgi:type II secretory pathway component GspD/PulD (secretin)